MNWICIATGIMRDPSIIALSEAVGVSVPTTTGHVVGVLTSLPEGSDTGDLSTVSDKTVEQWAMWGGKRGAFAAAFRAQLCDAQGVVRSWDKYNGRALRKMKADRERKRTARSKPAVQRTSGGQSTGRPADIRETSERRPGLRDETRRDEVLTTPIGAVSTGDAARRLTAAANKGIAEQFGEQPVPIRWDHPGTAATVAELDAAGVPTDEAERWLFDLSRSKAPADGRPPRTLRYYAKAVVEAWHAEQAHRDAATLPRPAGTGTVITWDDVYRANTEPEGVRDVA
jgi:hypothetical protein